MLEKQDIQTIAEIFNSSMKPIKEELQDVKGEIRELKEQVQGVEGEVRELKERVQGVEGEVRELKERVQGVEGEVRELKERVQGVEGKARELEGHVQGIRLTLENETNKNINIVGEVGFSNASKHINICSFVHFSTARFSGISVFSKKPISVVSMLLSNFPLLYLHKEKIFTTPYA